MHLFQRIGDILSANLNEMVERFEDPELGLKLAVREMEDAVELALNSAVKAVAHEKLLAKQVAEHQGQAEHWQQRAQQHITNGKEEHARRAIVHKLQHDKLAAALNDQHAAAAESNGKLRRQIAAMQVKLAEAKRTLATMIASKQVAEARKSLGPFPRSACGQSYSNRFDRLLGQVELAEAETAAFCEIAGIDADLMEDDVTFEVEQELAALKARAIV